MIHRICLLFAVAGLSACGEKPVAEDAVPAIEPKAERPVVTGKTVQATEQKVPRFLRVTGQLAGQHDAVVAADAMGKVVEAPVERGDAVKAGDVLVKLDERQAKLVLAEAEASLELAKSRLKLAKNEQERNAPLAAKKAIADADFQRLLTDATAREAEVAAAVARCDMARKTLEDAVIKAPFAGVVAERLVEPGEYVRSDSPVARVVDLTTLRLVMNVPETEVGKLTEGQRVEFSTAAYPDRSFTGTVKFLGAALREAARDLVVEAEVENADGSLRPGFFCDARIELREEKAVVVPVAAVRIEGSRRRVFVADQDGTLSERLVEVGEERDGQMEIVRGVAAGDRLLLSPGPDAADGASFKPEA
ncbi:MAG: efflux RND transporter periplasmic adaptor subunit [Verrucomicrobiales bacterium]|nr:efflux RND transporter periplasmic adaptor subunit [Verrucomicrobiales bacterium]